MHNLGIAITDHSSENDDLIKALGKEEFRIRIINHFIIFSNDNGSY